MYIISSPGILRSKFPRIKKPPSSSSVPYKNTVIAPVSKDFSQHSRYAVCRTRVHPALSRKLTITTKNTLPNRFFIKNTEEGKTIIRQYGINIRPAIFSEGFCFIRAYVRIIQQIYSDKTSGIFSKKTIAYVYSMSIISKQ